MPTIKLTTRTAAELILTEMLTAQKAGTEWVRWDGVRGMWAGFRKACAADPGPVFTDAIHTLEQHGLIERQTGCGVYFKLTA